MTQRQVFVVSLALMVVANAGRRYSAVAAFSSSSTIVRRLTLYLASPPSQYHQTPVIIRDIVSCETIESLADILKTVLGQEEVSM